MKERTQKISKSFSRPFVHGQISVVHFSITTLQRLQSFPSSEMSATLWKMFIFISTNISFARGEKAECLWRIRIKKSNVSSIEWWWCEKSRREENANIILATIFTAASAPRFSLMLSFGLWCADIKKCFRILTLLSSSFDGALSGFCYFVLRNSYLLKLEWEACLLPLNKCSSVSILIYSATVCSFVWSYV